MNEIVYSSLNGTSEKYAKLLGRKLYLTVYSLKEAKTYLDKKDQIVYVGWVKKGKIVGLNKARKTYNVRAICAVGMEVFSQQKVVDLTRKNKVVVPLFYLQGGLYLDKLKGLNRKYILKRTSKEISRLNLLNNKTQLDNWMLEMYKNGGDFVNESNLVSIVEICNNLPKLD